MSVFRKSCRSCFIDRGQTILLVKDDFTGDWVCPNNPRHKWKDDVEVV